MKVNLVRSSSPLLLLSALTVAGCLPPEDDDARRELLTSWGDHVILPQYAEFSELAAALDDSTQALCAAPTPQHLGDARADWDRTRAPWKRMELLEFGPYTEQPWRVAARVDFWPARIDAIEQVLADDAAIDLPTMGAAQVGMPVIEYLLFDPNLDDAAQLVAFRDEPRRCAYLTALTGDLAEQAARMSSAWDPDGDDYLAEFVGAGQDSVAFASINDAVSEVVNRMYFTVENIRTDKLGVPLSADADAPQPDKAESRFSGRSVQDIRDNLRGIELMYFGSDDPESLGVDDFVPELGDGMRSRLRDARDALDAIPEPLTQAVVDEPATVQAADPALAELQRYIQVDVLEALGLAASFNDADGD